MFTTHKSEIKWGDQKLILETGHVARQADGAVMATLGDTVVLAAVCFEKQPKAGLDFFPLTVNYTEKFYAAGRIPGGFFKREGRPTEKETLTCRLIDRPIRPLFPKAFKNETQVTCTVLSSDGVNDPDILAMVATSAALRCSGAPFQGPISAARVGYIGKKFVLNPTKEQREDSSLDLIVAGTDEGVLMVESEATELPEETMLDAVMFGHEQGKAVIKAIEDLAKKVAKEPFEMPEAEDTSKLAKEMDKAFGKDIEKAYKIQEKQERSTRLSEIREAMTNKFAGEGDERDEATAKKVGDLAKKMESDIVRGSILSGSKRIDGRTTTDIRNIVAEVDVLPRSHGSALFTRGETQALVVATLGTGRDEQIIDAIDGEYKDNFMLHYNFPPFSVGECGRVGFTSRREVGHGRLARRALSAMLPGKDDFPYTIRIVSEITESNGSSSMATVCGTSLALMAAGVPMPKPVAGIAMGLIKEDSKFQVLSDILGDEDHLGDMDFKVAGTDQGITALQMDIKITSITKEIMQQALAQAKDGRLHILGKMSEALEQARDEISQHAPGIATISVPVDKIRDVIGSGGKVIRELIEVTGCSIDIEDDGTVYIAAVDRAAVEDCIDRIEGIIAEPEIGVEYTGPVTRVADFGAFVRILPNHEGLVHVSEMVPVRVEKVEDIVREGETLTVKVVDIDDRGKVRLTIKEVPQAEEIQKRMDDVVASSDGEPRESRGRDRDNNNRDNRRGGGGGRHRARRSA